MAGAGLEDFQRRAQVPQRDRFPQEDGDGQVCQVLLVRSHKLDLQYIRLLGGIKRTLVCVCVSAVCYI